MPDEGVTAPSRDLAAEVTEEADSEDSDHDDDPVEWGVPQFVRTKNPSLEELKPSSYVEQHKKDMKTYYENVLTCAVGKAKSWVVQAMLESRAKWVFKTLSDSELKEEYIPDLVVCCKNYYKWKTSKFECKKETNESISQLCRKLWVKDSDDQIRARREQFFKKMEEPGDPGGDNMWKKLNGTTTNSTTKKFNVDAAKKMYTAMTEILEDRSRTQKTWEICLPVAYQKPRRVKQEKEKARDKGMLHTSHTSYLYYPQQRKHVPPTASGIQCRNMRRLCWGIFEN